MKIKKIFAFLSFIGFFSLSHAEQQCFTQEQENQFVDIYSTKYQIPPEYIKQTLEQANFQYTTYAGEQRHHITIEPPQEWDWNFKVKVSKTLVMSGRKFMCQHKEAFKKAQELYGVQPNYILGILGMETRYGGFVGNYKALDTLTTLAFTSPQRGGFFQEELAQYIVMCYKNNIPPTSTISSIDGGIGMSQFMPSSYNQYAVSYKTDEPANLFNGDDEVLSVANYLHKHSWNESPKNFKSLYSYNHSILYVMRVYQLGYQAHKLTIKQGC